ncbi:Myosin-binding protein 7-like protein [Drosera capensis]
MDLDISVRSRSYVRCCDCECDCSSSGGTWIRSVKRKHDEFAERGQFCIPGLDYLRVARVEIENECLALREMVSRQQETIQELYMELDEERNAASSAASEAMSMILKLQGEKAEIQMEARQFKRFAEEKMSHDAQEIAVLEDVLYKRAQAIESLTCEVQAYKHRMMSYGFTEAEAEGVNGGYSRNQSFSNDIGQVESPSCAYPPLRCSLNDIQGQLEFDDDAFDDQRYPFGETPRSREHLKRLECRIYQLERTSSRNQLNREFSGTSNTMEKVIVGYSPKYPRHLRRFSMDSSNSYMAFDREFGLDHNPSSPGMGASFKKMDCVAEELRKTEDASEFENDMSDRVCAVDSVHHGPPYKNVFDAKVPTGICEDYMTTPWDSFNPAELGDADIKKLFLRIQDLEADRESLKQTIGSMQTDKAQLVLLREIAQQLCKDMSAEKRKPLRKPSIVATVSCITVFKTLLMDSLKFNSTKSLELDA